VKEEKNIKKNYASGDNSPLTFKGDKFKGNMYKILSEEI
jgi:hypothetical protein